MDTTIHQASRLQGSVSIPGDKSISHRALIISALGNGSSVITDYLDAADPRSTMNCLRRLGIEFEKSEQNLRVKGKGLHGLRLPVNTLDAGNSGTTIRLLSGVLAGQPFASSITGDDSLRTRPMKRIIDPLTQMGARFDSAEGGFPPLTIHGSASLRPVVYNMPISSAQVKSAVLLAGLFAEGKTTVIERHPTRDHTERMLGLRVSASGENFSAEVQGGSSIPAQNFQIPGDISSAAFVIAAALIVPNSDVRILNVGLNPTRTHFMQVLRSLGASIEVEREILVAGEPLGDIRVVTSALSGHIELNAKSVAELIDEIPILAVTLAVSRCGLTIHGASDLRHKESDRIRSLVINLRKLGLQIEEHADGFSFEPASSIKSSSDCDSFGDHRIAMAFGVAGLALPGVMTIRNSACVDISFPSFWETLKKLQIS